MNSNSDHTFKLKYMKYKQKYIDLKNELLLGGEPDNNLETVINSLITIDNNSNIEEKIELINSKLKKNNKSKNDDTTIKIKNILNSTLELFEKFRKEDIKMIFNYNFLNKYIDLNYFDNKEKFEQLKKSKIDIVKANNDKFKYRITNINKLLNAINVYIENVESELNIIYPNKSSDIIEFYNNLKNLLEIIQQIFSIFKNIQENIYNILLLNYSILDTFSNSKCVSFEEYKKNILNDQNKIKVLLDTKPEFIFSKVFNDLITTYFNNLNEKLKLKKKELTCKE